MKKLLLSIILPVIAWADYGTTLRVPNGLTVSLESGTVGTTGDLQWTGSALVPQGNALAYRITSGMFVFDSTLQSTLMNMRPFWSAKPILADDLNVNALLGVYTSGGFTAKVSVAASDSGSITLRFLTYGVSSNPAAPSINKILNNSSRIDSFRPNYGIAPSSLFVITGANLAGPGQPTLQSSSSPGIPQTLNGASITVNVNGVVTHPPLWYTSPSQIAAVLPAATPIGSGTITVTRDGITSAPAAIQVVSSAIGINMFLGTTGVATDGITGALITYEQPAKPDQYLVLWATGLGANPADSDSVYTTSPHRVDTPLEVYLGGKPLPVLYAGSAGYPGVNQINIQVPHDSPLGCFVTLTAVGNGVSSNAVTLPVSADGEPCRDPITGLDANRVTASFGATLKTGVATISHSSTGSSANITFEKYPGRVRVPLNLITPGSCTVLRSDNSVIDVVRLAAGQQRLAGPDFAEKDMNSINDFWSSVLGAIPSGGGSYTFRGTSGVDVGAYAAGVTFTAPLLTWSNPPAAGAVDRSQPLPIHWKGGTPGSWIQILGIQSRFFDGLSIAVTLSCLVPVEAGSFTVPSYILSALPAGPGVLSVANVVLTPFSAPGLDAAWAAGSLINLQQITYR